MTATKTISEFLSDVDPWGIYLSKELKADFHNKTGLEPNWPEHTAKQTAEAIADRGLGGTFEATQEKIAWGYEVAVALTQQHAPSYHRTMQGRGSAFREAVEALKGAGK